MHASIVVFVALLLASVGSPRDNALRGVLGQESGNNADVIIIGAGMAGVTAARELQERGISSIVLEARDRVGGRTYSVNTTFGPVDTGAMWIHDSQKGNPLFDFATESGERMSRLQDYNSGSIYMTDGSELPRREFIRGYASMGNFRRSIVEIQDAHKLDPSTPDVSLYDVYESSMKNERYEELIPVNNLQVHANYQVLLNGNLTNLSTLRYGDAKTLPAEDVFLFNGFDILVKIQTPGLDIRLENPVESVAQTDTGVTVTTASGKKYTGKYALTTETLGCLKAKSIIYDPPLPISKQLAIGRMGMGTFDKAILVFDQSYWDDTDFIMQTMNDLSGLWKVYLNYDVVMQKPVLVALNVAETARNIERMTDEEIKSSVMNALRVIYPDIPDPAEFYATRWFEDPWSRGAYSYYAVGNQKNITMQIAKPFGRVYFAGEAASAHPGTVLGAYTSGKERAEEISKLI